MEMSYSGKDKKGGRKEGGREGRREEYVPPSWPTSRIHSVASKCLSIDKGGRKGGGREEGRKGGVRTTLMATVQGLLGGFKVLEHRQGREEGREGGREGRREGYVPPSWPTSRVCSVASKCLSIDVATPLRL